MQTFFPDDGFWMCAQMLDNRRLGKQRVECLQILKALRGETKGWRNHPATLMWNGHEDCLGVYMNCMIDEWEIRGFKNTIPRYERLPRVAYSGYFPEWMLDQDLRARVTASHRSNLLRKDPEFYGKYGWKEPPDLPYFWPVTKEEVEMKRVLELCP